MTELELTTAIQNFAAIVEDYISATNRRFYMNDGSTYPDDGRPEVSGTPWASTDEVLSIIPVASRTPYLPVNVMGVPYWFLPDGSLVQIMSDATIPGGSVTLAKLANIAANTVLGNLTGSSAVPVAVTIAALMAAMNLSGINTGDQDLSGLVAVASGYSLMPNGLDTTVTALSAAIASITAALAGYVVDPGDGSRLITPDEATLLDSLTGNPVIRMPNAGSVGDRITGMTEGSDYPTGWVLAAGTNPNDLLITHNLGKDVAEVTIWANDGTFRERLYMNKAYSGITADNNTILIQNLATIATNLVIHLIF